jgi:hypothetical protein
MKSKLLRMPFIVTTGFILTYRVQETTFQSERETGDMCDGNNIIKKL